MSNRRFLADQSVSSSSSSQMKSDPFKNNMNQVAKDFGRSILLRPFSDDLSQAFVQPTEIQRNIHGLLHAVRVAILVLMILNLYRLLGDSIALRVTERERRILELAALAHDAGRTQDKGVDKDEVKSAYAAIAWLKERNVSREDIILIASIIANKNYNGREWYQYNFETNTFYLEYIPSEKEKFFSTLLNIADGLDISRCVRKFKRELSPFPANLFSFYGVFREEEKEAINYDDLFLLYLNNEIKAWLRSQGDLVLFQDQSKKEEREFHHTYDSSVTDLLQANTPILHALYHGNKLYSAALLSFSLFFPFDLSPPTFEYVRGIRRTGEQYYESIFIESEFLFQDEGNVGRSIAALLPGTTVFFPLGYFVDLELCQVRSIEKQNCYSGSGEKLVEPVMTKDKVDEKLREIYQQKMQSVEDSYAEIIADIRPESVKGLYYICQENEQVSRYFEVQIHYLQLLFHKRTGISLKVYQYDPLNHQKTEVTLKFSRSAKMAYDFLTDCLDELMKYNRLAKVLYGNPDSCFDLLVPYQQSLVQIFELNAKIKNWFDEKREESLMSFIDTHSVSREFFYIMRCTENPRGFFSILNREGPIVKSKYDIKIAKLLGLSLSYTKEEGQELIRLEEKIRFGELEEADYHYIFNLSVEDLAGLIDTIVKSKKIEKENLTVLLDRLPNLSWKTIQRIIKSNIYAIEELPKWVDKIDGLYESAEYDSFDFLNKVDDSFDIFFIFFERIELKTCVEYKKFALWFDLLKEGCQYLLATPLSDRERESRGDRLGAIISEQIQSLLNCKYQWCLTQLSSWVVFLKQQQELLKKCNVLEIACQELKFIFNDWKRNGVTTTLQTTEKLIREAFESLETGFGPGSSSVNSFSFEQNGFALFAEDATPSKDHGLNSAFL